ncbi:MAG: hypothetical protein KA206_08940 [Paludibacter sp.]|nr:hypothetical protein [Paludibacter sp.]
MASLEKKQEENISLPFRIVDIKENGFIVKVSGLFAFVTFNHMPWRYNDRGSWLAIQPKLLNKLFFCKIHKISKDPMWIIINGQIPQFKKVDLEIGNEYKGIIIKKYSYGVLIDIGYHFDWQGGSFVGFLHKSGFSSHQAFINCSTGDEIHVFNQEVDVNGQLVFTQDKLLFYWNNSNPQELIGQVVSARVVREINEENQILFIINDKYKARIDNSKAKYSTLRRKKINEAKRKLNDGEIITCEVIGCDDEKKVLCLRWIIEFDTHFGMKNTIENGLDFRTLQKLLSLKDEAGE